MCLIVVGWQVAPDYPLVVAANRDEYHARPSAPAGFWADNPNILGGRDLEAGGTWLGATRDGRFAAVTNVREPGQPSGKRTRGELTRNFLHGSDSPAIHAATIAVDDYAGFNLLLADGDTLVYRSNRTATTQYLPPGIYGLSNHQLDTPWPKLLKARQRFADALPALPDPSPFFELLADRDIEPDDQLPATGVPLLWERLLSAVFVQSADYGTRASTVLLRHKSGAITLFERNYGPDGSPLQSSRISTAE